MSTGAWEYFIGPPGRVVRLPIQMGGPVPAPVVQVVRGMVSKIMASGPLPPVAGDLMPDGYRTLQSFTPAGGTWIDALAVASGKVWIPKNPDSPDGNYYFDAAWTQVLLDPTKPATLNNLNYTASTLKSLTASPNITHFDGQNVRLIMRDKSSNWPKSTLARTGSLYDTTPLSTLEFRNGVLEYVGAGITLVCNDQGHLYHGFSLWKPQRNGVRIRNGYFAMSVEGGVGYGGNPPYETFQSAFKECPFWTFDGHISGYNPDGTQTACVGMTCQESPGFMLGPNAYFEGQLASSFVAYQTPNWHVLPGCRIRRDTVNESDWGSGCFINAERSPGGLVEGTFIGGSVGDDVHISFAGDEQWSLNSIDSTGAAKSYNGHDQRLNMGPGFNMVGPKLWRNGSDGRPIPTVRVWASADPSNSTLPIVNGQHWRYAGNPIGVYTTSTWKDDTGTARQVHVVCYGVHTVYTDARQMPAGTTP